MNLTLSSLVQDSNERDVDDDVDDGVVDDVDVDNGQADENEKLAAMTMTRRGPGAQCRHHKSSPPLYSASNIYRRYPLIYPFKKQREREIVF